MMLKTMQFNDHLPLTLGAKVGVKAPMLTTVDIDLTVRWVGDIMDDEVQVSDINHPAAPQASEKFARQLFDEPQYTINGRGGYTRAQWEGWLALKCIDTPSAVYEAMETKDYSKLEARVLGMQLAQQASIAKGQTATGMQMLMQAETKRVEALRGALRGALSQCVAAMVKPPHVCDPVLADGKLISGHMFS